MQDYQFHHFDYLANGQPDLKGVAKAMEKMRRDRYFYSATSFVMLLLMLAGFRRFYFEGKESGGNEIPHSIFAVVVVHGVALTIWVVLFFAQSVLNASNNRRIHMRLGWAAAAVALVISASGPLVAMAGPRLNPGIPIAGMTYTQFMLPMFSEIAVFTAFVVLGLCYRRKPSIHRSMMLLATLSIISGATFRIPLFHHFFGAAGWMGLFGPALSLGVLIALVRAAMTRTFDRSYAAGLACMACAYILAMDLAVSGTWSRIAERIVQS